jgi:hypothetical protein
MDVHASRVEGLPLNPKPSPLNPKWEVLDPVREVFNLEFEPVLETILPSLGIKMGFKDSTLSEKSNTWFWILIHNYSSNFLILKCKKLLVLSWDPVVLWGFEIPKTGILWWIYVHFLPEIFDFSLYKGILI